MRRNVFEYHRPRADPGARPDRHRAEHGCADANVGVIFDRWMPLAALLPRPAQRHTLVHRDVVADRGCLADHDTHAVVDEDALSDPRSRMNLDPGDCPAQLRQETRGKEETFAPQPVRDAVERDRMQTGGSQNSLNRRARGRVTLPDSTYFP